MTSNQQTAIGALAAALAASVLVSVALGQNTATLEKSLESQYALTTATADNLDIVTAGAVITLRKRGLQTADATVKGIFMNTYKGGQLKPTASCQMMGGNMVLGTHIGGNAAVRTFVNGEKLFVTKIDVDRGKDAVSFDLLSDGYNKVRYRATLRFEFGKEALATADTAKVTGVIAEVLSAAPPEAAPAAPPQMPGPAPTRERTPPGNVTPPTPPPAQRTPAVQPDAPPPLLLQTRCRSPLAIPRSKL